MSARRRMPDPEGFFRLTRNDGPLQSASRDGREGDLQVLCVALDRWLYTARTAYAACDPETVRRALRNARALYGEMSNRADMSELSPWTT